MTNKVTEANNKLRMIKVALQNDIISYENAKGQAEEYIEVLNEAGEKVAKEFGKKYKKITFASLMR